MISFLAVGSSTVSVLAASPLVLPPHGRQLELADRGVSVASVPLAVDEGPATARFALSASNLEDISLLTPSKALKSDDEPAAMAVEPAVKAEDNTSRVGASCWSSLRSCRPSETLSARSHHAVVHKTHQPDADLDQIPH